MGRDKSDGQLADYQMAKYHQSVLDTVLEKEKDLKKLATETLTSLEGIIIKEVEEEEQVSHETELKLNEILDLLSTGASKVGNNLLIECRRDLRHAIHPDWPYNFPDPFEIAVCFKQYRDGFEIAIGLNAQEWAFILKEGTKNSYYKRIEDRIGLLKESIKNVKNEK